MAYCGLTINAGSRDELEDEHGLAHFLEHLLFKGTKKRKAYHINNRLESVGGELNAFTGKEETVIHATVLSADFSKTVELIADVCFNSIFPEAELKKEKEVIADEINSYKDSPAESIFDDFEELIFAGSPLGRNILGDNKTLKRFKSEHLHRFISRNYSPDRMVLSSVGRMSFKRVIYLAEKYFSEYRSKVNGQHRLTPPPYQAFKKVQSKGTHQTHCIIGNRSFNITDDRYTALVLLTNLLGGPLSNSRLNTRLRERLGLAYSVEASCTPYCDTGLFNIYFGTGKASLDSCINATMEELRKLGSEKLNSLQLQKAKKQLVGQLTIANESGEQLMLSMGKSLLSLGHIDTPEESLVKIENVSADAIMEIANELFAPETLSILAFQ